MFCGTNFTHRQLWYIAPSFSSVNRIMICYKNPEIGLFDKHLLNSYDVQGIVYCTSESQISDIIITKYPQISLIYNNKHHSSSMILVSPVNNGSPPSSSSLRRPSQWRNFCVAYWWPYAREKRERVKHQLNDEALCAQGLCVSPFHDPLNSTEQGYVISYRVGNQWWGKPVVGETWIFSQQLHNRLAM